MGNFFDCVRSRQQPISDVESQHRSATTCHLGNIAYRMGEQLEFDPERQVFPNHDRANALLSRKYREPYVVPVEL